MSTTKSGYMKSEITQRDKIARMASQRADGASIRMLLELDGIPAKSAQRHICVMVVDGRLFRAARAGSRLRWFSSEDAAAVWEQKPEMSISEWVEPGHKAWERPDRKRSAPKAKKPVIAAIPERPGVPANVVIPSPSRQDWAARDADARWARIIVCPAPTSYSRTYVDPKTRVVGGFATMGIGRYAE